MRLAEVLKQLAKNGIRNIGTWRIKGRNGITLGDPAKYFPHPPGPRYQMDTTDGDDPDLDEEELQAIRRRFNCEFMM
jgi:hypothetical protein